MTEENIVIEDTLSDDEKMSIIEAVLFAAGYPVGYAKLASVTGGTPAEIKKLVNSRMDSYNSPESFPRGIMLLCFADSCQLCTKQHYLTEIRDALGIKKSGTLSSAALETLAIVAYNQPVTRLFVDTLRKVDSSYAMNSLIDRGLIECKGRLDVPGRPMLYGTTADFLRCFGINDLDSLPKTSEEISNVFINAKLGDNNDVLNEEISEINNTDGEQITISEVAPDAVAEETAEEILVDTNDEPSAEDDIIADM